MSSRSAKKGQEDAGPQAKVIPGVVVTFAYAGGTFHMADVTAQATEKMCPVEDVKQFLAYLETGARLWEEARQRKAVEHGEGKAVEGRKVDGEVGREVPGGTVEGRVGEEGA